MIYCGIILGIFFFFGLFLIVFIDGLFLIVEKKKNKKGKYVVKWCVIILFVVLLVLKVFLEFVLFFLVWNKM